MLSIHWLYRRSHNSWRRNDVTYDVNFQYGGRQRDCLMATPKLKSNAGDHRVCKKKNLLWLFGADRKIGKASWCQTVTLGRIFQNVFSVHAWEQTFTWAAALQNQQNDGTQRRLRSAWASVQSDQSSLSTWRNIGPFTYWAHWKLWTDWVDAQGDLSLRWIHVICWFCRAAAHLFYCVMVQAPHCLALRFFEART